MESNNTDEKIVEKEDKTPSNPEELRITRDALNIALKKDLGSQWTLTDFQIKEFTKQGDNYTSKVVNVSCKGSCNGIQMKTSYIAKINPLQSSDVMDSMFNEIFERESMFLTDVAVKLNKILKDINQPQMNFPECFYYQLKRRQELLISRDLRLEGFTMFDKKVGMDLDHSSLVVKELAKLHASSLIFIESLEKKTVLDIYPFLNHKWLHPGTESRIVFDEFMKNSIDTCLRMIELIDGYERQYKWLSSIKDKVSDIYSSLITNYNEKMRVICHGDCWNNNALFKYNTNGKPKEVALVDLQLCKFASLGFDLNYFFYTSLTGEFRKQYLNQLLSLYFGEFERVMNAAGVKIPFTEKEVRQEVADKTLFGVISGLNLMPFVLLEGGNAPDMNEKDMDEFLAKFNNLILKAIDTSPVFQSRILSIMDDILDKELCE